ncbi:MULTISPECIES: Lrp/AsnC family transcriptional regulator [Paenibacillus]|uniref:Transcriptional regulator, AsnC family n=2 Tax=Paenibacillus lactis TaxID=228574 RepID=G4HGG5_9BACL|nr:Lrp/AsnC family transcriptional regulator [Paenibacillus lactis]EHB63838.1 transcriptional regulator, AsnC family [Paenibacillus lactis 154]MBP1893540.1 DNA-binding Lrp family transcriptional regulator [Paenibacillus lactis]GIO92134.1 AsnC family transcriptional regulator [Paenibacillus lactis]HAF97986.1 Lrp/AsnC family transcriptional regulator [Paenibacillus lactis]
MDRTDVQILELLQNHARLSMTELGKLIGLSQPAVTERVRKLEEQDVIIGYRAVVSTEKLNKHCMAYLLFHTKHCENFIAFCEQSNEVVECHRISGQHNYLIKVVCDSMRALEAFINQTGQFGDSTTLIVMSSPIENRVLLPSQVEE